MKNNRLVFVPLLFALLFAILFVVANPYRAHGQMTIPTRTPVPDDGGGDNGGGDNGGGDNGGGDNGDNNQPPPADTPQPVDTALPPPVAVPATNTPAGPGLLQSPTPIRTISASSPTATSPGDDLPDGTETGVVIERLAPGSTPVVFPIVAKVYPTAEPCGEPPTITTLTTANVYEGPGSDYPISETLGAKEVRPIVGRAAFATWWLVQLDGKFNQAWISDKAGTVQGYTGNIPVIEAPSINGALPTPGEEEWDPTPLPICTPTPTPTSDGAVISGSIAEGSSSSSDKVQAAAPEIEEVVEQRSEIAEAAPPLELEVPSTTPTPNLLPIAGLVLVVAAIFVALFLRRSPSGDDPTSD